MGRIRCALCFRSRPGSMAPDWTGCRLFSLRSRSGCLGRTQTPKGQWRHGARAQASAGCCPCVGRPTAPAPPRAALMPSAGCNSKNWRRWPGWPGARLSPGGRAVWALGSRSCRLCAKRCAIESPRLSCSPVWRVWWRPCAWVIKTPSTRRTGRFFGAPGWPTWSVFRVCM